MTKKTNKIFNSDRVLVIAEIAQSYEGSFDDAKALVEAAAAAKADAVKFHVFYADELAVPSYQYYDLFRRIEFTPAQWRELAQLAKSRELLFFADVLGIEGLRVLEEIGVDGLKIHATDMENVALLKAVGASGRAVLLSCGGALSGEISNATRTLRESGAKEVCLLHGFQASPTPAEDSRMLRMRALSRTFDLPVGYADHIDAEHELASVWPLIALGIGAGVIEKHLILDRSAQKEDYISALNPDEFQTMVDWIRLVEQGLGREDFDLAEAEQQYRLGARKRVVATRALKKGATVGEEDIALKRTPDTSAASRPDQVVGRVLSEPVQQHGAVGDAVLTALPKRLRVVATLACRAGGSRLYGKPVQRIGDRTILEYLVARLASVSRIDQIVLAISEGVENELFIEYADKLGLEYIIGSEVDVQERLIIAGEHAHADLLLRSTTESPFVYTDNIEDLIERHIKEKADISVTEGLPDGSYCEIITLSSLKDAHERGEPRHRSELCTLYMFEHPERYKHLTVQAPPKVCRAKDIRLTVDYPEDLIVCRRIAEELGKSGPLFSLEAVVDFLDAHPQLNAVNNWIDSGIGRIWA
jgi:N,N'-diacetyllegionaminate synthase